MNREDIMLSDVKPVTERQTLQSLTSRAVDHRKRKWSVAAEAEEKGWVGSCWSVDIRLQLHKMKAQRSARQRCVVPIRGLWNHSGSF